MKKMFLKRTFRYYYLRFLRLKGNPHFVAKGVAIGVFIGITPTIPLHTFLVLTFSIFLRGSKIAALLASVAVSNPLTFFFQYYFSWKIGTWLTGSDMSWDRVNAVVEFITTDAAFKESIISLFHLGIDTLTILLVGGFILALPFTFVSYILSWQYFNTLRNKRLQKKELRRNS